jgi:hypothetical protein
MCSLLLSVILKDLSTGEQDSVIQTSETGSRTVDFDRSVSHRKRCILESYSTGDIHQVVATKLQPKIMNRRNTDFTSPAAKGLYREAVWKNLLEYVGLY